MFNSASTLHYTWLMQVLFCLNEAPTDRRPATGVSRVPTGAGVRVRDSGQRPVEHLDVMADKASNAKSATYPDTFRSGGINAQFMQRYDSFHMNTYDCTNSWKELMMKNNIVGRIANEKNRA
jgi:hypothetical protein